VQLTKFALRPGSNIKTKTFWVHAWNYCIYCPRREPLETRCMSSARYGGAWPLWPDKDEKTKHASL